MCVGTHNGAEFPAQAPQMLPEWMETPVNGFAAAERSEPAIGIGRQRIGVHDEGARRCRLPVRDNIGGTPGRRRFHEVGGLCIEETMDPRRIVEKAIAPVDDQSTEESREGKESGSTGR